MLGNASGTSSFWVIQNLKAQDDETGEPLFWSNTIGWVDQRSADRYTPLEKEENPDLPVDGMWVASQG